MDRMIAGEIGQQGLRGMDRLQEGSDEERSPSAAQPYNVESTVGTLGSNSKVHFVIIDLREELVVYINGSSYIRREVE